MTKEQYYAAEPIIKELQKKEDLLDTIDGLCKDYGASPSNVEMKIIIRSPDNNIMLNIVSNYEKESIFKLLGDGLKEKIDAINKELAEL